MICNKEFFPFENIRPQQNEVIDKLNSIPDDKPFIFLEAGTGTGKSALAYTIAKTLGPGYIVTTTKQLQDQYSKDFEDDNFTTLYGKGNYECSYSSLKTTADEAPCNHNISLIYNDCKGKCDYFNTFNKSHQSDIICTSYSCLFSRMNLPYSYQGKKRKVIVFDEAHNLENQLVSFATISFNALEFLQKFYKQDEVTDELLILSQEKPTEPNDIGAWLIKCYKQMILPKYEDIEEAFEEASYKRATSKTLTATFVRQYEQVKQCYTQISMLIRSFKYLSDKNMSNWIFNTQSHYKNKDVLIYTATPINAGKVFKSIIDTDNIKLVFMSATILNMNSFAKSLDLDIDKCAMISLESPFDPRKAPILPFNLLDLKYKPGGLDKETIKDMMDCIVKITSNYPDCKGIIHTGNSKITQIILKESEKYSYLKERLLCRMDTITNKDIIEQHLKSREPTIIVSSSLIDGADLYEDLSRFQIIVKMPFLSLGDKRIKLKSDLDPLWYSTQTWTRLIQAAGRSIRSENDEADTFILDKAFEYQYYIALKNNILPKYFINRINVGTNKEIIL